MSAVKVVDNTRSCLCVPCWGAKCAACGGWLSKHDHNPEEAERGGLWVLEQGPDYHFFHDCPKAGAPLQLELV